MTSITTRRIETAPGIELEVHEAGTPGDPVVVLCHGFPETAHTWGPTRPCSSATTGARSSSGTWASSGACHRDEPAPPLPAEGTGFFGPISWYRNLDANYERTVDIAPSTLTMPTFFIGGTRDGVIAGRLETVEAMATTLPNRRGNAMIEGVGHWTQQEAPDAFNEALLGFVRSL